MKKNVLLIISIYLTALMCNTVSAQTPINKELWGSEFNLIQNWNFDTDLTSWGGWVDTGLAGQIAPVVVDGVVVMKPSFSADSWHYQHNQENLGAEANVGYTLKFKSWATADATPCAVDFEDTSANGYKRYGTSTDPEAVNGESEWHYNVNVTPQWFEFHVTFDKMIPTTIQKLQWMLSLSNETISLDSVLLVKDEYLELPVTGIVLNADDTIKTNRGTLQMVATVAPVNAKDKNVVWSVAPEGIATISATGLLTPLTNGTVTVKAIAAGGSLVEATTDVVISGQVAEKDLWSSEFNLINNWNFDTDMNDWGGWVDGGVAGQLAPVVVDGVAVMKVGLASDGNNWHYQNGQDTLTAEPNVAYVLKFKSWATADATPCAVDFESGSSIAAPTGDQYGRYGATTDPESGDLRSEWHYNVGTTPQWFTFHVTFDKIIPTTIQKLQWMLSLSNETISLDSILLVKEEYLTMEPSPVANAGADVAVNENAMVTLDGSKSSAPNAEELTYRWVAPAGITLSSTTEAKPTFTAPEVTENKTYTLTLVVSYGTAKPIADQVVVTVNQVDVAPYIKEQIADISVFNGDAAQVIDLTTVFADDDAADVFTYSIVNSNDEVVSAVIDGSTMTISFDALNTGTSVMEVTATSNGKSVTATFNIEVKLFVNIQAMDDDASMQVYPNPTRGKAELKLSQVAKAGTMITVYNTTGQVIYKSVTAKMSTTIDLSGNPAGMYFIKVGQNTSKLILE